MRQAQTAGDFDGYFKARTEYEEVKRQEELRAREEYRYGKPGEEPLSLSEFFPNQRDAEGHAWVDEEHQFHREGAPAIIHDNGTEEWFKHGARHRIGGPAITSKRSEQWYQDGVRHREDGPALISKNGEESWYRHGTIHREGAPAQTRPNGDERWVVNGRPHRVDGPAIIWDGREVWMRDGVTHRDGDLPAVKDADGGLRWFKNGNLHRENGPAYIKPDGTELWFLNGQPTQPA